MSVNLSFASNEDDDVTIAEKTRKLNQPKVSSTNLDFNPLK